MKQHHRHLTSEQITVLLSGDLSEEVLRLTAGLLIGGCAVCLEMIRLGVGGPLELGIESLPEGPPART
ncbi:MAG: hypothetical protein ACJ76J_09635 [Thermoanaerobaculia bacterium]